MLLAQKKTKMSPPYDPSPYKVTGIRGHQITAVQEERSITRDAQKWKRLEANYPKTNLRLQDHEDPPSEDDDEEIIVPDADQPIILQDNIVQENTPDTPPPDPMTL